MDTEKPEKCSNETEIDDKVELKTSTKVVIAKKSSKTVNFNQLETFNKKFKTLVERSLKFLTNIRFVHKRE